MDSFGKKLRKLRDDADLSQTDLINIMKCKNPNTTTSKSMISKWENEKEEPSSFQDVATLSEVFGVTTDYLIGLVESKHDKNEGCKKVPILGVIAAGVPILAQEDIEGYDYVPDNLHIDFCLRVKGDSMIGARILDGDLVYIQQQPDVENGEIAVILIDQEATLKRVFKVNGTIILHPENPNYKDMVFSRSDMRQIFILGKAVRFNSEVR